MSPDELLAQATCAILVDGRVKGTAWLCSTRGHLLTAGHILGEQQPLEAVEVRFLDDIPRKATRIAWGYQKQMGIDWAVLMLGNVPEGRQPLPISFSSHVEGTFILRGFGMTLADASSGRGDFIGALEVQNSREFRLFRLRSQEIGEGGYSGGAVFSERLQAAVAIQIEAPAETKLVGRDTILAMPLFRVPPIWDPNSGLRPSGVEPDAPATYSHHILVSYSRKEAIQTWVEEFFIPELRKWLDEELGDGSPEIFWDHNELRDSWARSMVDIVRGSRYLIALLTPSYFRSPHCLAELESFLAREELEKATLLTAIEWHHGEFPKDTQARAINFREFAITTPGFKNSGIYIAFEERVKRLAASLGTLLESVPPYRPTWPVVAPAEVKTKISAKPHISKPLL